MTRSDMKKVDKLVRLLIEMVVVGVGLALLGLPVSWLMRAAHGKKIVWWPKHARAMLTGTALTGAAFHLICEVSGLNQWYVKRYVRLL